MEKKMTGYPSIDKPWLKYYTEEQINAPLPHMTAYEYVKTLNAERLDYLAIDSEVGNYTYRELFAMIDQTAAALWSMGIRKGKHVLAMFPVLPHESFLFYGIDAVGAALCQIAPQYTPVEVCNHANRIGADLFFVFDQILTPEMEQLIYQNTKVRHIIVVNFMPLQGRDERTLTWDAFIAQGKDATLPDIQRDPAKDVLFFASTSGSTGVPKTVMLSDNCFNTAVHQYLNSSLSFCAGDSMLKVVPAAFGSAAVAALHLPYCSGMQLQFIKHPENADEFADMLLKLKPNHSIISSGVLSELEANEKLDGANLDFVKVIGCGGMSITPQFEENAIRFFTKHNINTFLGYSWGNTESAACASNRISFETTRIGSSGVPMVNTVISVFDRESDCELEYGEVGELCICSPSVMLGYYNDEELTQKALRVHKDGKTWLHTGDVGMIDPDGFIWVKGRTSRILLTASMTKVYPQATESVIAEVTGVQGVIVCGVPDMKHEGFVLPVCFIVPEPSTDKQKIKHDVEQLCYEKFDDDSRPRRVFIKERLPLTKGNKPDILALEKEAAEAMLR